MAEIVADSPYGVPVPSMMTQEALTPLEAAERAVRAYCGWHVAPVVSETVRLDGNGRERLALPSLRVHEITALTVDGRVIDAADIQFSTAGILCAPGGRFPEKYGSVLVTMVHGFDPGELSWIVRQIEKRVEGAPAGSIERVTVGQRSVTYRDTAGTIALLGTEKNALAPFKLNPEANL